MKQRDRHKPLRYFIVPYHEFVAEGMGLLTVLRYQIVATYPKSQALKTINTDIKSYSAARSIKAKWERLNV